MGDLREPNGGGTPPADERPSPSPSPSPAPEQWARAEKATQSIIFKVQPTAVSEERRKEVIDYVQRLIRTCLGCEFPQVFPYGSVPLKTYLPDGDIDLTAFGGASSEDMLADDMVSVLEGEDRNRAAEFVVKDVQLIRAEVKLVKCIVQNIVVDISFNQIGGLCTLCFLEQVDRLIGKEHLFKRSIILIKAWCYYESRILGAHHGLISTYALETLVLYIFHLFHSTLNGPLAVLYKFLDYFSKFDWENYCISLNGPLRLSSLPEFVAETPENGGGDLLLSSDFLRYCIEMFSVTSRGADSYSRTFQPKHLNIVDPLKENNNLGRSVSKGNFYRIRSAFTYGARKLRRILVQPEDDIDTGLSKFFSNTLDRHGNGQRPDVQGSRPVHSYDGFSPRFIVPEADACPVETVSPETKSASHSGTMEDCMFNTNRSSHKGVNDMIASGVETKYSKENGQQEGTVQVPAAEFPLEADQATIGNALDYRTFGDAKDLATSRVEGLKISSDLPKYPDLISQESASPVGKPYHAPHLYFRNLMLSDGELKRENLDSRVSRGSVGGLKNGCGLENHNIVGKDEVVVSDGLKDNHLTTKAVSYPENSHHVSWDRTSASAGTPKSLNTMSDLSGDYDSHFNYLQCGRWCYDYAFGVPAMPMPSPPPSLLQIKNSWDAVQHPTQFEHNGFSHGSVNGVIPSPAFYTVNPLLIPGMAFGLEDMPKPRGTGTYFPNMSRPPQGYRPSAVKGRNQPSARSPQNMMFMENNILDQSSPKLGASDVHQSFSPRGKGHSNANGLVLHSESGLEFGSVGNIPVEAPLFERRRSRQQRSLTSSPQNTNPLSPTTEVQRLKPVLSRDHDRISIKSSYRLKDEDDFPPLSV